jgi:hypothetical protein
VNKSKKTDSGTHARAIKEAAPAAFTRREVSDSDLRELFAELNAFRSAYTDRIKTGERKAYREALLAVSGIACIIHDIYGKGDWGETAHFRWFENLRRMLEDLENGIVHPVLDCPVLRKNALPTDTWMWRAEAVEAVERLRCLGMRLDPAAQKVIDNMPGLEASVKDLRTWCSEFRKDKVNNHWAREKYQFTMAWLRRASRAEIEHDAELWFRQEVHPYF